MTTLWDPLENVSNLSQTLVADARRREIRNILKSYVGFFDPFAEAIQNAMDAIDRRQRVLGEPKFQKRLWISVDLQHNTFGVTDNGCGFSEAEFKTFLCPSVSFNKDGETTRGRKGVGATYLAYGFNHLQLGTKTPEYTQLAEMNDGRSWVEDDKGITPRPQVSVSEQAPVAFARIDRGSTFTIRFGGGNTRPGDLGWINATTAEQWRAVLLLKTPLGHISIGESGTSPLVLFDIEVIDKDGKRTSLQDQEVGYVFPHCAIASSVQLKEILEDQAKRLAKGRDPLKIPDKFQHLNAIYGIWNTEELCRLLPATEKVDSQTELLKSFSAAAYAFLCYTTDIWDAYNDDVIKLRKKFRILRGGLQLATNNMPQGELLPIPLQRTIGYQNQTHVVIHFRNAEPDLGRKGFQPELQEAAEQAAVGLVNHLKRWRHLLRKDAGGPPKIIGEGELYEWLKNQEEHQKTHPLKIANSNFFIPVHEVSILSEPQREQDVIALFNQLIAGGVIRGIKLMATNQHEKYDGVFRYSVAEPLSNHIFDTSANPLGVKDLIDKVPFSSRPYVLEYKYTLDALIRDFENEEKYESDVDLVVVWEAGSEWKKRYSITSLLDLDNLQHRPFHGLTHVVRDDHSGDIRFNLVVLSELIAFLQDVNTMQGFQKSEYGEAQG